MENSSEVLENSDGVIDSAGLSEKGSQVEEPMGLARSPDETVWPGEKLSPARQVVFVFIMCMAQFTTQASFVSVLLLSSIIGDSFGVTNPGRLTWLTAGFSLTVGSFILFSGRLGDLFGYKRLLLIGLAWFAFWSVVVGLSTFSNYTLAVFARVLQGIGPAICLPNALALLGSFYPPGHLKAMIFACFGAVAPIGAIAGSAVASALAIVWWPWALWALGIWLVLLTVLAYIIVPDVPRKENAFAEGYSLKRLSVELDLPGGLSGVVALVLFNFAWNQAPIAGWASPEVIVPLVVSLGLFGLFGWIEYKVATKPLVPFDAINRDVGFVLATVSCGWAAFAIWISYFFRIPEEIRHMSPIHIVAWAVPLTIVGLLAAMVTGQLLGPFNVRPSIVMTVALCAFTIGVTLIATVPPHQTYWGQTFICTIIIPFGMDMSFPAATLIISNAVKKEHQGTGASLVNTVVNYSISLGVGIAGTVELHVGHGDKLASFRGGLYMGIGVAALGFGLCILFLILEHRTKQRV
ncbi:major facilitator superfamily transporter [Xylaria nigripes]|nr:major facilitator superfamily transporter [Xylaria nigripes]